MGRACAAAGHELVVVAPGAERAESKHDGMRLIRYAAPPMPYDATYRVPWRLDFMCQVVRRERPDVVQISSPFAPALAARFCDPAPLKIYVHHSDPIGCYLRPALQRALPRRVADCIEHAAWGLHRGITRGCDATVVSSHFLEAQLSTQGCERVTTVPFGITRSDLGPQCEDSRLRAELLGPLAQRSDAILVLIAGRLAADKRQALLIDALQLVHKTRPVALVVLGDGPERHSLRSRAFGLGHVTFLKFTHNRAEFARILASVDCLIHGALAETYGFVIAESLASGTPVVAPAAGGAGALVDPSCGELYSADANAHEVARAVHRLLSRPLAALSQAALRVADTIPSSDDHFRCLFDLYARLLAPRRRQQLSSNEDSSQPQCAAESRS